jgi:phosphoribosylformylglycinamidine synthase
MAHGDGNYFADDATLARLEGEGRVVFRYVDAEGQPTEAANRNGARNNIAGIVSDNRRILGMMPHPEDLVDPLMGGEDGLPLFRSITEALVSA